MNPELKKKTPFYKKWWFIVISVFFALFIIGIFVHKQPDSGSKTDEKSVEKTDSIIIKDNMIKILNDSVDVFLKKGLKFTKGEDILVQLVAIRMNFIKATNGKYDNKSLKNKIQTLFRKQFPIARRTYADMMKNELWEKNIDIRLSGTGNTTITLVGATFANRANIKSAQQALSATYEMYRFKKIIYKWFEQASETTEYDINSQKDDEI